MNQIYGNKIFQNIIAWIIVFIILTGVVVNNEPTTGIIVVLLFAPPIYVNNLFLLPYFKKNSKLFFLLFLANTIFFTLLVIVFIHFFTGDAVNSNLLNVFGILFMVQVFGAAIKLTRDNFEKKQNDQEIELKLLKGQLNPHFLFNTLNNLYGLSVIKSDKLPPLMLQLSDMLRYSLYETKEKFVPLKKEIDYLQNYISLESIRLEDEVDIHFIKSGDWDNSTLRIAPMVLIVFIENAFKHLDSLDKEDLKVEVKLDVNEDRLTFNCINSFTNTIDQQQTEEAGGIGLENVKKRLELIYSKDYTYEAKRNQTEYIVNFSLLLK